jgi:hypothetical protein
MEYVEGPGGGAPVDLRSVLRVLLGFLWEPVELTEI